MGQGPQDREPPDIPKFLATLTPVQLRTDTKVTNHGFESGEATSRRADPQAGTSVLVDRQGIPGSGVSAETR